LQSSKAALHNSLYSATDDAILFSPKGSEITNPIEMYFVSQLDKFFFVYFDHGEHH
jgi:hypothetical protein